MVLAGFKSRSFDDIRNYRLAGSIVREQCLLASQSDFVNGKNLSEIEPLVLMRMIRV